MVKPTKILNEYNVKIKGNEYDVITKGDNIDEIRNELNGVKNYSFTIRLNLIRESIGYMLSCGLLMGIGITVEIASLVLIINYFNKGGYILSTLTSEVLKYFGASIIIVTGLIIGFAFIKLSNFILDEYQSYFDLIVKKFKGDE